MMSELRVRWDGKCVDPPWRLTSSALSQTSVISLHHMVSVEARPTFVRLHLGVVSRESCKTPIVLTGSKFCENGHEDDHVRLWEKAATEKST
jgi:hypothetical protein